MSNGIRYTVQPSPSGQKVRFALNAQTGEMLDAVALPPKRLRHKAKKKRAK